MVGLCQKSEKAVIAPEAPNVIIPLLDAASTLLPVVALEFPPNTPYVLLKPILIGRDSNAMLLNNATFPVQIPLEKIQGFVNRWVTPLGKLRNGASGVTGIAYDVMPMPVETYR